MIKVTIQNRIFKITTNKNIYTINAPNTVTLLAQSVKGDKGDTGDTGDDGHSLLYDWDGTQLGIKLDNESSYTYTDLKGDDGGLDYTNMTLDTSPVDADVVPVNGTRNDVLSQLKISLANIKNYILGTLFNTSSGHDHDGTDSKQISASNITGLFDSIYPVGSIYMSVNSTNPGTLFGGTWQAWGAGRVPVGFDSSQSEFDTVEETGGSKTHTLTVAEMPSHNHTINMGEMFISTDGIGGCYAYDNQFAVAARRNVTTTTKLTSWVDNSNLEKHPSIGYLGSGSAHNNLQPYITCYMWKRTA